MNDWCEFNIKVDVLMGNNLSNLCITKPLTWKSKIQKGLIVSFEIIEYNMGRFLTWMKSPLL